MHNDPELNGKYLGTITKDFVLVADVLKEASYLIRKKGFSNYPIFPICKLDLPIGNLLIHKTEKDLIWNYYISYLDEFLQRTLITPDGLKAFQDAYKDPDEFCCLFVVDMDFTNFVFIPFPED